MTAIALLRDLRSRGVHVRRDGENLIIRGPAEAVAEARGVVRAHKAELLAFLPAEFTLYVEEELPPLRCEAESGCGGEVTYYLDGPGGGCVLACGTHARPRQAAAPGVAVHRSPRFYGRTLARHLRQEARP